MNNLLKNPMKTLQKHPRCNLRPQTVTFFSRPTKSWERLRIHWWHPIHWFWRFHSFLWFLWIHGSMLHLINKWCMIISKYQDIWNWIWTCRYMIIYVVSWRYHWCSGCKCSTLPRPRIGLQTVSLFAVSARTLPAQCETRDEISGSGVSLRSGKRAPTERGIKPWIEGLPETLPLIPQFKPPGSKFPGLSKRGPAPKWMGHKRGKKEIKSELHQLTPMTHYAKVCYATLVQHAPTPFASVISIVTASTCALKTSKILNTRHTRHTRHTTQIFNVN